MSRVVQHNRLTCEAFEAGLVALDLTGREFAGLTDVGRSTYARWFLPRDDPKWLPIPYWVTVVIGLALLPGGRQRLEELHYANLTEKPDDAPQPVAS